MKSAQERIATGRSTETITTLLNDFRLAALNLAEGPTRHATGAPEVLSTNCSRSEAADLDGMLRKAFESALQDDAGATLILLASLLHRIARELERALAEDDVRER